MRFWDYSLTFPPPRAQIEQLNRFSGLVVNDAARQEKVSFGDLITDKFCLRGLSPHQRTPYVETFCVKNPSQITEKSNNF